MKPAADRWPSTLKPETILALDAEVATFAHDVAAAVQAEIDAMLDELLHGFGLDAEQPAAPKPAAKPITEERAPVALAPVPPPARPLPPVPEIPRAARRPITPPTVDGSTPQASVSSRETAARSPAGEGASPSPAGTGTSTGPRSVACPTCGVAVGRACRSKSTYYRPGFEHEARVLAARGEAPKVRPGDAARAFACPKCKAEPGHACVTKTGWTLGTGEEHGAREALAGKTPRRPVSGTDAVCTPSVSPVAAPVAVAVSTKGEGGHQPGKGVVVPPPKLVKSPLPPVAEDIEEDDSDEDELLTVEERPPQPVTMLPGKRRPPPGLRQGVIAAAENEDRERREHAARMPPVRRLDPEQVKRDLLARRQKPHAQANSITPPTPATSLPRRTSSPIAF